MNNFKNAHFIVREKQSEIFPAYISKNHKTLIFIKIGLTLQSKYENI